MDIQNISCQKCEKAPEEYIQLNCEHNFCLVCLLVMESRSVLMSADQHAGSDQDYFLCEITCEMCTHNTLLDKNSTDALMHALNALMQNNQDEPNSQQPSNQSSNDKQQKSTSIQENQQNQSMSQENQQKQSIVQENQQLNEPQQKDETFLINNKLKKYQKELQQNLTFSHKSQQDDKIIQTINCQENKQTNMNTDDMKTNFLKNNMKKIEDQQNEVQEIIQTSQNYLESLNQLEKQANSQLESLQLQIKQSFKEIIQRLENKQNEIISNIELKILENNQQLNKSQEQLRQNIYNLQQLQQKDFQNLEIFKLEYQQDNCDYLKNFSELQEIMQKDYFNVQKIYKHNQQISQFKNINYEQEQDYPELLEYLQKLYGVSVEISRFSSDKNDIFQKVKQKSPQEKQELKIDNAADFFVPNSNNQNKNSSVQIQQSKIQSKIDSMFETFKKKDSTYSQNQTKKISNQIDSQIQKTQNLKDYKQSSNKSYFSQLSQKIQNNNYNQFNKTYSNVNQDPQFRIKTSYFEEKQAQKTMDVYKGNGQFQYFEQFQNRQKNTNQENVSYMNTSKHSMLKSPSKDNSMIQGLNVLSILDKQQSNFENRKLEFSRNKNNRRF